MGEIKSTMDIIMEKTKGLTMSEEEKAEYKLQELTGKVKGLIQKFLDGILDLDRLKIEMSALSEKQNDAVKEIIFEESMPHIELGADNEPVFKVLTETAEVDTSPIREMERTFIGRIEKKRGEYEKSLGNQLEKKGISGSAVIPNLKADPDWKQYLSHENDTFRAKLSAQLKTA